MSAPTVRQATLDDLDALAPFFDAYRQFYEQPIYPSFSSVGAQRIYVLNDLFVAPEARKLGIGRALLEAAANFGRRAGAARLALSTARTNLAAQALYESLGWVRDDEFHHYGLRLS